ncbi:carbohydrate porin [Paraburkholderia ultramafica]|nr:carbohydrate porin [Paraburkholderia ultramafica]
MANPATPNLPVPQPTADASLPVASTASVALAQLAAEDARSATTNTEPASAASAADAASTAAASPAPVDAGPQRWNAHIQSTYIFQTKDSMHAPYTGANSLLPRREYGWSWSVTAAFGVRLWSGAELYFDPEMVAARAISHAAGLGGLADGEISKTADPNPTTYYARLFLRQTWDLGGDHTPVDSDMNQLAGPVASRRIVLTIGNYSPTDIFGQNTYAGDPRTQFFNAALMTYGAWDYPSDARGYTWGAALEYYRDAWAFRVGRFLQPRDPNGLQLNYRPFEDYGDAAEVEHNHSVAGRPGKLSALVYRNRADMGDYGEAVQYAAIYGGTPALSNVRATRVKTGFGVHAEQSLTDDIGAWISWSQNNGSDEEYAYAEIDRQLQAGVSIKGTRWHRQVDTVGIAYTNNGLSGAHAAYLAAGGIGGFLGDGALSYHTEDIYELYYSAQIVEGVTASLDYQHIANPGYNHDRGPVDFFGARMHLAF